jgi:hypothetical protein
VAVDAADVLVEPPETLLPELLLDVALLPLELDDVPFRLARMAAPAAFAAASPGSPVVGAAGVPDFLACMAAAWDWTRVNASSAASDAPPDTLLFCAVAKSLLKDADVDEEFKIFELKLACE